MANGPEHLVRIGQFQGDGGYMHSIFVHATTASAAAIALQPNYFGFARIKLRPGDLILVSGRDAGVPQICAYVITSTPPEESSTAVTHAGGAIAFEA